MPIHRPLTLIARTRSSVSTDSCSMPPLNAVMLPFEEESEEDQQPRVLHQTCQSEVICGREVVEAAGDRCLPCIVDEAVARRANKREAKISR